MHLMAGSRLCKTCALLLVAQTVAAKGQRRKNMPGQFAAAEEAILLVASRSMTAQESGLIVGACPSRMTTAVKEVYIMQDAAALGVAVVALDGIPAMAA
jgi:hypothetical protein